MSAKSKENFSKMGIDYKSIIDTSQNFIFLVDESYHVVFVNKASVMLFGKPIDKIIGRTVFDLFPKQLAEEYITKVKSVLETGKSIVSESVMFVGKKEFWIITNLDLITSSDGKNKLVMGVSKDISDRKNAEQALKKSEEKYKSIIENIDGMIYQGYPDWSAEIIKGSETLCGYSPKQINSKNCGWADLIFPEHRNRIFEGGYSLNKKSTSIIQEYKIITKDKKIKWVADYKTFTFSKGEKFPRVNGIVFDINEKKKALEELKENEWKYRSLFQNQLNAYAYHKIITDKEGKPIDYEYLEINHMFEKFLGLKKEQIIGKRVTEIISGIEKDAADWIGRFGVVALTGKPFRIEEFSDVLNRWYLISAYSPRKGYFVAVFDDITDRKKYELALKDSKNLIEEEVKKKTKELKNAHGKIQEYVKKLDLKLKRIDKKRVPLTNKEKLAFYGLVRYPNMTSKEIGGKIGLQEATVNSIKNRLKKEHYFRKMYLPRYDLIGSIFLSLDSFEGDMKAMGSEAISDKAKKSIWDKVISIPELIYAVSSEKEAFSFSVFSSWQTYRDIQDFFDDEYHKKGIKFNLYDNILFSLDKTTFFHYFNFASLIRKQFEIDIIEEEISKPVPYSTYKLNLTGKKLIYGLMRYPEFTVANLSKKIGLSVPTICKLKRDFLEKGIIKVVNFPDFSNIGMDLIVLVYGKQNEILDYKTKKTDCINPNIFFSLQAGKDCATLAVYKNYADAQKGINNCPICSDRKAVDNFKSVIIPLETINYSKLDFASMVKKLFDLDVDF